MVALINNKVVDALEAWLNAIKFNELNKVVRTHETQPGVTPAISFGSEDFYIKQFGLSKDEPKDCYLLEVRASPTTKVSALAAMASKSKSKSLDPNQKRLAFILIDQECAKYMEEDKYVKEAILAGPITEKGVINKVHVVFHSKHVRVINGVPNFQPVPEGAPPLPRFEYKLIPFPGYNVDGTLAAKSGQQQGKKKTPAGSSK